jgi:hypothetical protein
MNKYELRCECIRSQDNSIDDPNHPWYCWKLVKPDYEAAREALNPLLAFIYNGGAVHPMDYEKVLLEATTSVVEAAWDNAKVVQP